MATGVGNLSVKITANSAELSKGLLTASEMFSSWSSKTAGLIGTTMPRAIKSGVSFIGDAIKQMTTDPAGYVASKLKSIPKVGEALALPFEGISAAMSVYKEGSDRILELGRNAQKAGMGISEFQQVSLAAGPAAEFLPKALFKLNQQLGDAAIGSKDAQKKFAALGFDAEQSAKGVNQLGNTTVSIDKINNAIGDIPSRTAADNFKALGISAVALQDMMPIDRIRAIADAIQKIQSPALKAKMAVDLFGKSGYELLPFLEKGSAGIDKAGDVLEKMGLKVKPSDLANLKAAAESQKQIKLFYEAVSTQVTIGVGAILAEVAAAMGQTKLSALGLAEGVVFVAEVLANFGASALETFKSIWLGVSLVSRAFLTMADFAQTAFASILKDGKSALDGMINLGVAMADPVKMKAAADAQGKTLEQYIKDTKATMRKEVGGGLLDGLASNTDAVGDAIKNKLKAADIDIEKQKNNIGTSFSSLRSLFDNVRNRLAGGGPIELVKIDGAEKMLQFGKQIEALGEEIKTPFEAFEEKLADINKLMASGMLSAEMYNRALGKAFGTLQGGTKIPDFKAPAAVQAGSREAYSAILQFQNGDKQDPQKQMLEVLKESKAVQAQQAQTGRDLVDAVNSITVRGI